MRAVIALTACAASGLLLALAYPRAGLWPLAWVALAPWLAVVFAAPTPIAIIGSWLAGFAFLAALMYWVAIFGYLPWALLASIEGLAFVTTGAVVRVIAPPRLPRARVLAVAVAWVTFEFARSVGEFGVPWGQVGHSQAPFVAFAQLAAFGGVPAASFVVVLANAAIADAITERRHGPTALRPVFTVGAVVAGAVALGGAHARLVERSLAAESNKAAVRVAIAQPSLKTWLTVAQLNRPVTSEEQEWELSRYARLTRQAAGAGARLIIWPESAVSGYLNCPGVTRDAVASLARKLGVWLLVGGPAYVADPTNPLKDGAPSAGREYNSAYVISPQGAIVGRYDKVHLVPFGEYVPWRSHLPLLQHYQVRATDVARGASHRLLRADGVDFAPMICFESVFPEISRTEANAGARALIIITNDAWFLRTAAAAQHLQIGRFRAIEQGLWIARGAATGVSAFIDPLGRVTKSLGLMQRGVLIADIRPRVPDTPYRRVGPLFSEICAGVTFIWLIAALLRRKK
jgi:apolipoprotein N-acyltransferase